MTDEIPTFLSTDHPLFGASLKLVRARTHISEFSDVLKSFLETKPFDHGQVFYDENRGSHLIQITKLVTPPALLGAIAGDVIHNLRCVFDLIASEIAGGDDRSGISFPVCEDSNYYNLSSKLKKASSSALNLVRSYQPFNDKENKNLRQISKMDNWDKHRVITTVSLAIPSYRYEVSGRVLALPNGRYVHAPHLAEGEEMSAHMDVPINMNDFKPTQGSYIEFPPMPQHEESKFDLRLNFFVALEKTIDWEGEEALPALERLYDYTDTALRKFCSVFK